MRGVAGLLLLAVLTGCSLPERSRSGAQPDCGAGLGVPMRMYALFFGRTMPNGGLVTAADWSGFVDDTVTPNLPAGYTVLDAAGAWMDPATHRTGREPSTQLLVALPDTPDSLAAVNRVRTAYQQRFHQQMVGMASNPVCAAF